MKQLNLTEGGVVKTLLRFMFPFLLANLLQALYNLADMLIVGHYCGDAGISAVNIGGQIALLINNLATGFAVGATVLVSQYSGAGRDEDLKESVSTTITAFIAAAAVVTVLMLFAATPFLRLLETPEESFAQARLYLLICMGGNVFSMGYICLGAILRGMGDSVRPLYFALVTAVVNVGLDFLLVGPAGLKAAGAAVATVCAQAAALLCAVLYLKKTGFVFGFRLREFKAAATKLKLLLSIGLPAALQTGATNVSILALTGIVNKYGLEASSIQGIGGKVTGFAVLPNLAIGSAVAAMCGQSIGAAQHDRARKTMNAGLTMSFGIGAALSAFVFFCPRLILAAFGSSPEVLEPGVPYLRILCLDFLCTSLLFPMNGLINGSGHTLVSMTNALIGAIAVRIPLAFLLSGPAKLGLYGVSWAMPAGSFVPLAIVFFYIRTRRWEKPRVIR